MNRGFTLIEMLAVLVLLSVIVLVSIPSLIQTNKSSKEKEIEDYKNNVENACESYFAVNPVEDEASITVNELKDNGYLKKDFTIDESFSTTVNYENGQCTLEES